MIVGRWYVQLAAIWHWYLPLCIFIYIYCVDFFFIFFCNLVIDKLDRIVDDTNMSYSYVLF